MRIQFHIITILIQNQAVHNPSKRHHILDHGHPKKKFQIHSRSYILCMMSTITLNIYTHCLQDGYFYSNLKNLVMQFNFFSKCQLYANKVFVGENLNSWHPQTHSPRNYLQSFYWAALIHKCGKQFPFADYRNFSTCRRKRSSHKESDNNGTSLSSYDNETTPKYKKVSNII